MNSQQKLSVNSFDELVEYDQTLFVARGEVSKIEQWILSHSSSNRYFIVAPPGSGKTWLLKSLEDRLNSNEVKQFIFFWLNLPELFLPEQHNDRLVDWLRSVCKKIEETVTNGDSEIKAKFEQVRSKHSWETHLDTVNAIFDWCNRNNYILVIIVEEADEFGHYSFQVAEALGRALTVVDRLRPSAIIFTLQTESSLMAIKSEPESADNTPLPLTKISNPGDFCIIQFQYLAKKLGKSCPPEYIRQLFEQLKPYRWDNLLANNFLFYSFIQKDFQPLDKTELSDCCKKLFEIILKRCSAYGEQPIIDIDQCLETLKKSAKRKRQGFRDNEPSFRDLKPYWKWLKSHGYLEFAPKEANNSNTHFFLISSLNSLLYTLKEFEKKE